jgi:predicted metal-dependent enzyme (double-stranded beta helix superfamily)
MEFGRREATVSAIPQLEQLAGRIDAALKLGADAMAREIQAALGEATAGAAWLPEERRRAGHENYARHLLYGDPGGRYSILSIVWDHGQKSPIHGHYCWCAVGVYQGRLTESYYRESPMGGLPVLVDSLRRDAGTLSFDPPSSGIHRMANDSGAPAISLHVYGIGKEGIAAGVNRILT